MLSLRGLCGWGGVVGGNAHRGISSIKRKRLAVKYNIFSTLNSRTFMTFVFPSIDETAGDSIDP